MHHERSKIDRRSVRVRLKQKGRDIRQIVSTLFAIHAEGFLSRGGVDQQGIGDITGSLRRVERYWTDQIRYIHCRASDSARLCSSRSSLRSIAAA
jgi:hypothetical protein